MPNCVCWARRMSRTADRLAVDQNERQRILALATDFPAIWADPNTPQRERNRMNYLRPL